VRCYAKAGDVNGVRKVYKVLAESLRRDLDDEKAEPLPETTSLLRELTGSKQQCGFAPHGDQAGERSDAGSCGADEGVSRTGPQVAPCTVLAG